jgi:hypothetical protein
MAGRAAVVHVLMRSRSKDVSIFVAMQTKILRLCNKQILVSRTVRVVAYHAAARSDRSVNDPFLDLEIMAV